MAAEAPVLKRESRWGWEPSPTSKRPRTVCGSAVPEHSRVSRAARTLVAMETGQELWQHVETATSRTAHGSAELETGYSCCGCSRGFSVGLDAGDTSWGV